MADNFTISRQAIDEKVVVLKAIVDQVKQQRGNAAKRLHDAQLTALTHEVTVADFPIPPAAEFKSSGKGADLKFTFTLGSLAIFAKRLSDWAENQCDEAVTSILKASGNVDTVESLKAQYDAERKLLDAMLTVAPHMGIEVDDVEIPVLRGGRAPSGSRPNSTGTKSQQCYRIVNGERLNLTGGGGTFSALAWYFGAAITGRPGSGEKNDGKGVSASDLEDFLRSHGVDSPKGKAWTYEVDGVTFGMDVASDSSKDEEE